MLEFWIEADTFMRHMVRTLVGTMLERRARGDGARRVRGDCWRAAAQRGGRHRAAHGLYLESVRY